jgi:hypothetical protein
MKKSAVASVEKSNAEREPDSHKEILYIICQNYRYGRSDCVHDLAEDPVDVKENNRRE